MSCVTTIFATFVVASAIAAQAAQAQPSEMLQAIPPTPGANPDQRHAERFKIPLRLDIALTDGRICVLDDSTSLVSIPINVGKSMTVGLEAARFYYVGAERKKFGGMSIGTTCMMGTLCGPLPDVLEQAAAQGFVQFVQELTVFETDLPSQHQWQPKRGRYRVLWRGVAVGTYRPRQQR